MQDSSSAVAQRSTCTLNIFSGFFGNSFAALRLSMCYNFFMKTQSKFVLCLLITVLTMLPLLCCATGNTDPAGGLNSIIVTFDPPVVNGCNQSAAFYDLLIETVRAPADGIIDEIDKNGTLWSASQNLCGIQFSLYHFDDPEKAVQICKKLLLQLAQNISGKLKENRRSQNFADYIHSLLLSEPATKISQHKPVSISLSQNLAFYANELASMAGKLNVHLSRTSSLASAFNVLPEVMPTVYTVFSWPESSMQAFFTAKYFGEKFIREARLDQLLKYEIIYEDTRISLVVYLSATEEILAENMQKFRQINEYRLGHETPADWQQFSKSLSAIMADDLRDLAKKKLLKAWLLHWQGSCTSAAIEAPLPPEQQYSGVCMPEEHRHRLSFSSRLFPAFAAACHDEGGNICDICLVIGSDNPQIIDEIYRDLKENPSPTALTLTHNLKFLKITFHCSAEEVGGNLARLRNHIYNNLAENGMKSEPIDTLRIGVSGVSNLPPFEMRGLLQRCWIPVSTDKVSTPLVDYADLFAVENSEEEALRQRWQLYLASNRGRCELLAMIAAAGHQVKDLKLPR